MAEFGQNRILQFSINENALEQGRLNPHIPVEQAGDCGANSLFALDIIGREVALNLSRVQTQCRFNLMYGLPVGNEYKEEYLFGTYLFENIAKHYDILRLEVFDLLNGLEQLMPGKGTILLMNRRNEDGSIAAGHYVTVHRNLEGEIEIIDLQNNITIPFLQFNAYFDSHGFNLFTLPSINVKRPADEPTVSSAKKTRSKGGGIRKRKNTRKKRKFKF
jgi:hypothetical protein